MNLINNKMVFNLSEKKTKNGIFSFISNEVEKNGFAKSADVKAALLKREAEFTTGVGGGYAIPHGTVKGLVKPVVLVIRVKSKDNHINWKSLDNKPVDTIVSILVPENSGSEHLKILAALTGELANEKFAQEFKKMSIANTVELINGLKESKQKKPAVVKKTDSKKTKYLVGITACPTGIAHTFMAKRKLEDEAKKRGWNFKIETQGSDGLRNKLSFQDVRDADAVVFATGIELADLGRFDGLEGKIHETPVAAPVKDVEAVVNDAIKVAEKFKANPNATPLQSSKATDTKVEIKWKDADFKGKMSKFGKGMIEPMMNGISYMLPVLVLSGFMRAVSNITTLTMIPDGANTIGNAGIVDPSSPFYSPNLWLHMMYYLDTIGGLVMQFMYPIFTMYLAAYIGGKAAMTPGFVGGLLAQGLHHKWISEDFWSSPVISWGYPSGSPVPSSFFGALAIGFIVGHLTKYLNRVIQMPDTFITLKTMFIMPLIMAITVFFTMEFMINPALGAFNSVLQNGFEAAGAAGAYSYQTAIAAGTAADLGGPINKAAGAIANGLNGSAGIDDLTFNLTGRTLAIIIPPIGVGLSASFGNQVTRKKIYSEEQVAIGRQAGMLGVLGISEGAIPFLLLSPLPMILINMTSAVIGANIAVAGGAIQTLPLPAIWGWGLAANPLAYIIGLLSGVGFSFAATTALFYAKAKKEAAKKGLKVESLAKNEGEGSINKFKNLFKSKPSGVEFK